MRNTATTPRFPAPSPSLVVLALLQHRLLRRYHFSLHTFVETANTRGCAGVCTCPHAR